VGGGEWGVGSGSGTRDLDSLCATLVANVIASGGDIVSAHAMFLFDAALQTDDDSVIARAVEHLSNVAASPSPTPHLPPPTPVYSLARDYASCFKSYAVANRLRARFPNAGFDGMLAAVHHNLDTAPSFEGMAFA